MILQEPSDSKYERGFQSIEHSRIFSVQKNAVELVSGRSEIDRELQTSLACST